MHTRAFLSATLLAAASASFAADGGTWDFYLRGQVSATVAKLDGNAEYSKNGSASDSFSTADIGLGDSSVSPAVEIGLGMPLFDFHAHLGYSAFSTDGSKALTAPLDFGGQNFTGTVDSKAEISDLYVEACWAPLALNLGGVSIGLAAHQLSLKTTISAGAVSATLDESAVLPTLAVRAYVAPLDMLEAEIVVHALSVPLGDLTGTYAYAQAQVAYYPMTYIGVIAGYRHTMIDIEIKSGNNKAVADLTLSGPYLGLAAQF